MCSCYSGGFVMIITYWKSGYSLLCVTEVSERCWGKIQPRPREAYRRPSRFGKKNWLSLSTMDGWRFIITSTASLSSDIYAENPERSLVSGIFLLDYVYLNYFWHSLQGAQGLSCLKKSLPLSSTRMKAGKSSTVIFQMASMPSSGYSTHSMLLMLL